MATRTDSNPYTTEWGDEVGGIETGVRRQGANRQEFKTRVKNSIDNLPNYGRDLVGRVDRSARSHPWMHVGIAGIGGLILGMVLARSLSDRTPEIMGISEIEFEREEDDFEVDD